MKSDAKTSRALIIDQASFNVFCMPEKEIALYKKELRPLLINYQDEPRGFTDEQRKLISHLFNFLLEVPVALPDLLLALQSVKVICHLTEVSIKTYRTDQNLGTMSADDLENWRQSDTGKQIALLAKGYQPSWQKAVSSLDDLRTEALGTLLKKKFVRENKQQGREKVS